MFSPQHDFSVVFPVGNRVLSPQGLEFALILTEDETSTHNLFTQHKALFQRWCQWLFFITQLQDHTESFLFNFPSCIGIIPHCQSSVSQQKYMPPVEAKVDPDYVHACG